MNKMKQFGMSVVNGAKKVGKFVSDHTKEALAVVGIGGAASATSSHADVGATVTALQTSATGAITTVETAVLAVLTAGIVITIAFWAYGKMKGALKKN